MIRLGPDIMKPNSHAKETKRSMFLLNVFDFSIEAKLVFAINTSTNKDLRKQTWGHRALSGSTCTQTNISVFRSRKHAFRFHVSVLEILFQRNSSLRHCKLGRLKSSR